jgi:Right handed beta helix region
MTGLVDVTDVPFLAAGDGVMNCRLPVQAAIQYAKANNKAGIFFPSGNFKFSRANPTGAEGAIDITDVDGFTIAGDGAKTRLFQDIPPLQDWHLIRVFDTAGRVLIRDLTLDGTYRGPVDHPGVTGQHHLIRIGAGSRNNTRSHQVRVTNCYIRNCRGDGINIIGGTSAVGVLTLTGNPTLGSTVKVGSIVYRFVSALSAAFDVLIGTSVVASLDNLQNAINRASPNTLEGVKYGVGTFANPDVGSAKRETNTTLAVHSQIPGPLALAETLVNGSWDGPTAKVIQALTDEVMIDQNFIHDTYRTGIGVQRGCRKVIIDGNIIVPARRGVIDFEPTGSNVNTEDWAHGNSPQQFIITNNILVKPLKNNTVASLSGTGARDRDKYSIVAHNLCLGGGFDGLNVGPLIIDSNIIIGNRGAGGDPVGLIRLHRGCQDVIVSNNYLERPVPVEGETQASNTLEFRTNVAGSVPQQPGAGETVKVGTTTYTFRGNPSVPNDLRIGTTLAQTCDNLVAAILRGPGEGTSYGAGTIANPDITSASSDGESVTVFGNSTATQTTDGMSSGFWTSADNLANSAGPLIEVMGRDGVQPSRVTIVNNLGRQHMQSSGIALTSVSHAAVRGNQLHCYHSGLAGNGIIHRSIAPSDQVHIHGNHLMTHGTGRWEYGIRLSDASKLGHSSVHDNTIHGAKFGIKYADGPPSAIPTVMGNSVSGNAGDALLLPTPTCTGGNLGCVANYVGTDPPNFAAAKGSTYINTAGVAGAGGVPGTLRYVCSTGSTTWVPMIDG